MQNLEITTFKRKFQVYYTYQKLFSLTKSKKKNHTKKKKLYQISIPDFCTNIAYIIGKKEKCW